MLHFEFAGAGWRERLALHRAKRVHDHKAGAGRLDFFGNFIEDGIQILFQHHLAQVDKTNGLVQLAQIEEGKLLLIAEHLDGGFAQNREIERRFFRSRIGEDDLMRHRRFAAARLARDDVEGEFG